jgi:hypothetical protein
MVLVLAQAGFATGRVLLLLLLLLLLDVLQRSSLTATSQFRVTKVSVYWAGGDTIFGDARSVSSVFAQYETRITPAPLLLWFWVPIHTLGAAFTAYQLTVRPQPKLATLIRRIDPWYATANLLTTTWLVTFIWGAPGALWAGTGVLALLVCVLLVICLRARLGQTTRESMLEYVLIDCYFSLYCGWVTVFFTVNLATALYASGWRGDPWTEDGWACCVISLAAAVSLLVLRRRADVFGSLFSAVFSWTSLAIGIERRDTPEEQLVAAVAFSLAAVVGVVAVIELAMQSKCTAHSTQHTAHSTQYTVHSQPLARNSIATGRPPVTAINGLAPHARKHALCTYDFSCLLPTVHCALVH